MARPEVPGQPPDVPPPASSELDALRVRVAELERSLAAQREAGEAASALAVVARELAGVRDLAHAHDRVVAGVARLLAVQRVALYRLDPVSQSLLCVASAGRQPEKWVGQALPADAGVAGRAVAEGRPIWSADARADPRISLPAWLRARVAEEGLAGALGVPLVAHGQTVGALALWDEPGRAFSETDTDRARAFAEQAALALDSARHHEEARRRQHEAEALARLARPLAESLDVGEAGARIVEAAPLFGARSASLCVLGGDGALILVAAAGDPRCHGELGDAMPAGHGVPGWALTAGKAVWTADALGESSLVFTKAQRERMIVSGSHAALAVPLRGKRAVLGVLALADRTGRVFADAEAALLQTFADTSALALENARLFQESEHRRREAEALTEVGRLLAQALDPDVVMQRIADSALMLFGALDAVVQVIDPITGERAVPAFAGDPGRLRARVLPRGTGLSGLAIATARPVASPNIVEDPRITYTAEERERLAKRPFRAGLAVPLTFRDTVIGVVFVGDRAGRVFTEDDIRLAQALADAAALALANARLHEEAGRRRREAEVLAEVAGAINASLDLATVLDRLIEAAQELCHSDLATIAMRDPGTDTLFARYRVGPSRLPLEPYRIERGKGIGGLVLATGQPFRTADYAAEPRITRDYVARSEREGVTAELAVPIRIDGVVEGVLFVHNRGPRPFTDRDESILAQLADHAAIAIRNAGLYEESEERRARLARLVPRLRALTRLNQLISASLDVDAVLSGVARAAGELMGGLVGMIWTAEETGRTLHLRALSDEQLAADYPVKSVPYGRGLAGWVAEHRRALDVPDMRADERVVAPGWIRAHGLTSAYLVPVLHRDALLGVLGVLGTSPFRLGVDDRELLETFVAQSGVAIQNARIFAGSEARRRAAEALAQVGRALTEALDADLVARRIADSLLELFDAEVTAVYRREPSGDLVAMATAGQEEPRPPAMLPRGTGLSAVAIHERQPIVTSDLVADPRVVYTPEIRAVLERIPTRAALAVPLIARDRVLGALAVRAAQPFDKRAVELARAFADQAVVALENARLYQEAREAYEELTRTQEQLLQAQKMEAVGQLAGGVAHDFNNLLTVIVGRSELVLDALPAGDPLRTHVELSLETAERASTLVQQLLAFSRRQVLQPRVLDLNRVVVDMTKILQRLIGEDIVTTVELGRTLWRVKADPGQLEQVILNLAVNARDAMPRGGRLVIKTENVRLDEAYVRQHAKVRAGPYVRLTVSDTGVGMDAAVKGRMFEPFFTTKGPGKGTGLGLATVYGIVQQSGGHIAVESEPGRGTTFWVYLPRLEETVDTLGEKARAPGEGQRGSENVLLVEDDEEVRAIARIILETVGYRVLAVASPAEALATLARHGGAIDLLLTDVVMPEMSGPELAQRVRALRPDLRVLYMSGYTADAMLRHGIRETDVALLPKPFSRRALLTKVREVLDAPPRP